MPGAVTVYDSESFQRALTTNATDTSFASKVPTITEPTGTGVVDLRRAGVSPKWLFLVPIGTGDDDDVFEMWVTGWRRARLADSTDLWIPTRLVKLTCTLSTAVGVASSAVVATERFADTITATGGISNVTYQLGSTTDNTPAHALVDMEGCEKVEFTFDMTTGSPTGANVLYARV